jgi:hypothetical protein
MSGKHCGPSKAALDLDKKIGGAMDTVKDSFIGDAAGGIADGISGLKSSLTGLTDGIVAEIENAIPEIPKPKANLQEQMTKLMNNLDNPGALLSELEGIKGNFGGNINIDDMLSKAGVDPSKLEGLSAEFKDLQKKAQLQNTVGALGKLATGDLSAVKDLMGGIPSITLPGSDPASILDAICKDVPNLDLDADGNVIKKGIETKLPAADAEAVEEAEEKNDPPEPEVEATPADKIEKSKTVVVDPNTEAAAKIRKETTDELQARYYPIKKEWAVMNTKGADKLEEADETKRKKRKAQLTAEGMALQKEASAIRFYARLVEKDINYNEKVKKDKAGLLIRFDGNSVVPAAPGEVPISKPTVTWEEIHEKTNFSNYPDIINKIEAIPSLEIKGERPPRENFGG